MRALYILLFCILFLACGNKKDNDNKTYLPTSNGNLNSIFLVVDNLLWEGTVGESIRTIFAAPLNGLPVDEPMFKMQQIPTQVFDGPVTRNRIVLKIEKGIEEPSTKILNEVYAKPQTLAVVTGKTDEDIIAQLKENKAKIISAFDKEEIQEKQRRINKSLLKDEGMESKLGFEIDIPSAYKIEKVNDDFFWIRRDLRKGKTIDLMFYEVPLKTISADSSIVNIIKMRNQIAKTKVPGEDGIYMKIGGKYAPSLYKTIIDNKPTYEVRGIWDMQGISMAGPFVMYLIEDKVNKRYLVADGYTYAPSLEKRNYVFELDAIIKSIKIK